MRNAAYRLSDLLELWTVPSNTAPEQHRTPSDSEDDPMAIWRAHARATADLAEVERTLAGMKEAGEDVAMYEKVVPRWYQAIFAFTVPWQSTHPSVRSIIDERDLLLLQALGSAMDQAGRLEVDLDARQQLRAALDEAADLLSEDDTLAKEARHYLWGLIAEARRYLDEVEVFGAEAVRRVTFELAGACTTQASRSEAFGDEKRAGRWRNLARNLGTQSFIATVAQVGATIAAKAIGAG